MAAVEQLSPERLTNALRDAQVIGSQSVTDVTYRQVGTGQMAACYALTLTYDTDSPDLPDELIAKVPSADPGSRGFATASGAYSREVSFYQDIADQLGVRTPRCYFSEVNAEGSDFLLLLEDLSPAKECAQVEGCDADQAALALEQAAALHAGSWRQDELVQMDWLRGASGLWQAAIAAWVPTSDAFVERYGDRLDDVTLEVAHRLGTGAAAQWGRTLEEPRCLSHGDFRLDNLLFAGQGGKVPVAVVDWQSVTLGPGPVDVSYFIGSSLTTDVRRSTEPDLVKHYYQTLTAHGVDDYSWDQCWREYCMNTVAGFVVSVVSSVAVERTDRGDRMFTAMANRHARHINDHEAFELIEAS